MDFAVKRVRKNFFWSMSLIKDTSKKNYCCFFNQYFSNTHCSAYDYMSEVRGKFLQKYP